jgi:hypothetical protein
MPRLRQDDQADGRRLPPIWGQEAWRARAENGNWHPVACPVFRRSQSGDSQRVAVPRFSRADALANDRLTMPIGRGMISVRNGDESHPNAGHSVEIGFLVASYADRKPNMGSYRGNNIRRSWDGTNERNQQSRGDK